MPRVVRVLSVLLSMLLVAGCSGSAGRGPGMMSATGSSGSAMMGGFYIGAMGVAPHGYHLSPLTCSAPSSLPGTTVWVMLGDMGMTHMMRGVSPLGEHMMLHALPAQVPAGDVTFVVGNRGWRTHELVVLPLDPGQAVGQRVPGPHGKVDEAGSFGEASASCAQGAGDGIKAGSVSWVTLNLPAGRYELVCNLRNHYANGMHQLLVVT